ncbi:MAG: inosine/xanthosine triphosphatase [Candidatus Curtissbacteria bacterium]|nr:inosine/xanthosine triphosphatase [Candidatus Curtissbacteria bacterium]
MIVALGSKNPAKIGAAKIAFEKVFSKEKIKIVGVEVKSGISSQPMSDRQSIRGAINRAKQALKSIKGADFGVGMEGGIHKIGKKWFESGWIAVVDKTGKIGLGTSARWEMSAKVMGKLEGKGELSHVFEDLAKIENAKDVGGVMGLVTKNILPRDLAYSHGVIFALAPFFSDPVFWDE